MRALKTIVIGLGIVLVVGFGLLIYGVTQNWHRVASSARPAVGWGDVALRQPPGARVRSVSPAGNHVVLHVAEDDGVREWLIVVDPATGAVVGTFWVTGAP